MPILLSPKERLTLVAQMFATSWRDQLCRDEGSDPHTECASDETLLQRLDSLLDRLSERYTP
jgi:hypothetical protein